MRGNARLPKLLAAWCLTACGDALPSPSRVDSLRLLALTTDTPEALSGTSIAVQAVWYDPARRAGRFLWRLCPEAPSGDARACARPDGGLARPVSSDDAVTWNAREIALTEGVSSATWVVYLALCAEADPVYDPSLEHSRCAGGDAIESVRRVVVRRAPPLNQNPAIARVTLSAGASSSELAAQTPLACAAPCDGWTVALDPAPDAAEAGESLMASFYATAGRFEAPRALGPPGVAARLSTVWRPEGVSAGAEVLMWLVLRDQRGGESVRRGSVIVP